MILTAFLILIGVLLLGMIVSAVAGGLAIRTYKKYLKYHPKTNITGAQLASLTFKHHKLSEHRVNIVQGMLTDYYSPKSKVIYLSPSNFEGNSISALAVTAHELGHSFQYRDGGFILKLKNILSSLTRCLICLFWPLLITGIFMFLLIPAAKNIGAILFISALAIVAVSYLLKILTIPVEVNASKKALAYLEEANILKDDELMYAKKVLTAAALTYVGGLFNKILYYLKIITKRR